MNLYQGDYPVTKEHIKEGGPLVGILMGSDSDFPMMSDAAKTLGMAMACS